MQPYPNLEISWGTLRDSDLLYSFVSALKNYAPNDSPYTDTIKEGEEYMEKYGDFGYLSEIEDEDESDNLGWFIHETLVHQLDSIAPENCYFGSSDGDGSSIGFWEIREDEE